jgi:RHS repeat-associated protein
MQTLLYFLKRAAMKRVKRIILFTYCLACINFAAAQNLNNPNKLGPIGTQVNTFSGNLFIPRTDIYIPSRGFDLDISFNYNSYNLYENTGYGKGWSFAYDIFYKADTLDGRTICWGDGREDEYKTLPGGAYKTPRGFFSKLTQYQPNKYLLTELNGTKFYFDNNVHKKLTRMEEPNGNFINLNYTDTLLTSIVNAAGQSISFTYNANGNLASVIDAVASPTRTYNYTYDAAGNLTQVSDPLGGKYKYSYLVNGPMKSLTDKNNNKLDIIFYPDFSTREIIGCNKRISFAYDTLNKKTVVTDHLTTGNQVTTYQYQKLENLAWLTSISGNCCGFNMSYEFDDQGNKIKETDANGNIYTYTYDTSGNMLSRKDPLNQVSSFTYTGNFNKLSSFTDAKGNVYTMGYDAKGNLTQLTTPGNHVYSASYNSNGDIIGSTDPKGNIYSYNYDAFGNPTHVSGPNGFNAILSFDARGNLLAYTDARGNTSNAEYDILDRMKKIIDPLNNNVRLNYDAAGNGTSFINRNNETTIFNYDASNRIVKVTGPTGNQSFLTYDGMNNITAAKNTLGHETKYTYDTRNRLKNSKDPQNNTAQLSYDANGNITSVNLPNGQQLNYTYDALNRVTSVKDGTGTISTVSYDRNNNITSYTNGTGATTSAVYDSLNRIKKITDPLGNSSVFSYDKNNNITAVTDREGHTSHYTYDSLNRVKTYTDNNGFVITIGYDAMSNVTSLKDQNNNITNYTYDNLNRRKRMTYPDGSFNELTYDVKGNVIAKRQTDGSIINYIYDTLNRVITRQLPGGENFNYTYDKLGRVISAINNAGTVTLTYDALNRITSETFDGRTTSYQYNIAGRTQTTVYPDGSTVIKEFDTRNRLIKILKDSITLVEYAYNNANQLTNKTFANGVVSNLQYDFANRLSSISTANGSIQNTSFTYDKEMNKTAIIRQNNPVLSEQFSYDNGYRLINYKRGLIGGTPAIENTYSYDAVGNRTSANLNGTNTTYLINTLNQLTGTNGSQNIAFAHDGRGNLTYDGIFYKTYDAEGRLLKDSASPTNIIAYTYDVFNRRVAKTSNGQVLKYTYSGVAQIEERDAGNTLLNSTVYTNFLSPVTNDKNGSLYYYHQNELNSVEAISNSNGRIAEQYRYDVYGKPSRFDSLNNLMASSVAGNRVGFTGQEYDSASGSYRFFFRNYSTGTGVFNQRDLIEYGDGMGMYQYIGNNPANGVDVWGLEEAEDPCYHDKNKIRLISGRMAFFESQVATNNANYAKNELDNDGIIGVGNWLTGFSWISYGRQADSRFYGDIYHSTVAANEFYFMGNSLQSWDVNYFFTNAALRNGDFSQSTSRGLTKLWNGGKAVKEGLINTSYTKYKNRLNEGTDKLRLADKAFDNDPNDMIWLNKEDDFEQNEYGQFWPVINPETGEIGREFFRNSHMNKAQLERFKEWAKTNCPPEGGTRKDPPGLYVNQANALMEILTSNDPNAIIGPEGQPDVHWVSVKDRMPYTILYENSTEATAPAKYVRITTPIEPKQDANTFELGSFGFNSTTFTIPPNTSSYYNRVDARDSIGLYVDVTAGYDQMNNVAFWEFQSIDPVTLMPPADPLKGFLLLQDSTSLVNGHGFVNFSIKPKQNALTLDTIGAKADIVFDDNDTIPTNIHMNTIDAFAPTSHMTALGSSSTNPIYLAWTGADDTGGCGIDYYTIYVSTDQVNYSVLIPRISSLDTTLTLPADSSYCFFVLATDRVGNKETLRPNEIQCSYIGPPLPVTWLYFKGKTVSKNNLLDWATANEQNTKSFDVERSLNGTVFNKIGNVAAAGNSNQSNNYQYTDPNIDRLNSETMFYRLKQIDLDGNFKYSNIVRLRYVDKNPIHSIVYPNPTPGQVTILVGDNKLLGTTAVLYDINGRVLENIKISASSQAVDLSRYTNGTYFIKLNNKEVLKIIKN